MSLVAQGISGQSALVSLAKMLVFIKKGKKAMILIETDRLILRTWEKKDACAYFEINQDPKVIELLKGPLTLNQVHDFIQTANQSQDKYGYTLWAVELRDTADLVGFIGLNTIPWQSHFTPAIEIAWRLGSQYWGKGMATEGAQAALDYGFKQCTVKEIVSFTVPKNVRSIRVMEKIGLQRDLKGDFAHPILPLNDPLSHHILYRLNALIYLKNKKFK